MSYYIPTFRRGMKAPYGVEDVHEMTKFSCSSGYLAKGFLIMNEDLRTVCHELDRERDGNAELRRQVVHLSRELYILKQPWWRKLFRLV